MPEALNWLNPWWPDVAAFLRMGKHGAYVWPAFGLCALALGLEWWTLARQTRALRAASSLAPTLTPQGRAGAESDWPATQPTATGRGEGASP